MSRPSRWLVLALFLACLLPVRVNAGDDREDEALTLYYRAAITIEPDGTLSGLAWDRAEKIPAVLRERLDARVRTWQFEPGSVDGQPARTESTLRLRVLAEPQADGFVVRVENARTGAALAPMEPPAYPHYALMEGTEAAVLATLVVEPDGSRQVTITGYQGGKRYREDFVSAVEQTLAGTDVDPELVDGRPARASFSIPFTFCMAGPGDGECDDPVWPERKTVSEGPATTAPGSPVPTGSVARLLTDIRGTSI